MFSDSLSSCLYIQSCNLNIFSFSHQSRWRSRQRMTNISRHLVNVSLICGTQTQTKWFFFLSLFNHHFPVCSTCWRSPSRTAMWRAWRKPKLVSPSLLRAISCGVSRCTWMLARKPFIFVMYRARWERTTWRPVTFRPARIITVSSTYSCRTRLRRTLSNPSTAAAPLPQKNASRPFSC